MSSTSQVTTFSDLYTDLLNRLRVSTGVTATDNQAKRYINIAVQDIHLGFDYKLPWCERTSYLRTKAPYSTGTVSTTVGSTTITGSSTLWNTNNSYSEKNTAAGGKFIFNGEDNVYKVHTVSSDTSDILRTAYVGSADLSGATYVYFEDEYYLGSTFLRPIDLTIFSQSMGIALIPRHEFRRRYPVVKTSGRPRVACVIDSETTGSNLTPIRKVVFYPYPDQTYIIPYTYITSAVAVDSAGLALTSMSSDTDVPTMPLRYRHAIVLHALFNWYRDKKDDARAESAKAEYVDIMQRIVGDQDIAAPTTAQFQPQMRPYAGAAKHPYNFRGGRRVFDLNDDFDSFRR